MAMSNGYLSKWRDTLPIVALVTTFLSIALVIAGPVPLFFLGYVTAGISNGIMFPSLASIGSDLDGISPARGIAAYTFALSASLAIGPLYEMLVLKLTSNKLTAAMIAFLPLVVIGIFIAVKSRGSRRSAYHVSPIHSNERSAKAFELLKHPTLRLAIYSQLLYEFPFVTSMAFGAVIAHVIYHFSAGLSQLAFSFFFTASLCSRGFILLRPHRTNHHPLLITSAILSTGGILTLAIGGNPVFLLGSFVLLGIPHGVTYPLSLDLTRQAVSSADLVRANSLVSGFTNASAVIAPILLGIIADHLGLRAMILAALVPTAIFAIPLLSRSYKGRASQIG